MQCLFQVLVAVDLPLSDVTVKTVAHAKFVAVLRLVDAAFAVGVTNRNTYNYQDSSGLLMKTAILN